MVDYPLILTKNEQDLIRAIRKIGFGEMFGVEILDGKREFENTVTRKERDLIKFIRSGNPYIDVITVHQKEPVMVEIDTELNGYRCRRKIKFPTGPQED